MAEKEIKNIDINIDDMPEAKESDKKVKCGNNIDLPVDIVNTSRNIKKQKANDHIILAEKEKLEKEKAERIAKNKAMRKLHKKWAKNFLFIICLLSTISTTSVIGFIIWITFNPNEWAFSGIVTLIGMAITLLHTYAYRYIREEIYRK